MCSDGPWIALTPSVSPAEGDRKSIQVPRDGLHSITGHFHFALGLSAWYTTLHQIHSIWPEQP